MRTVAIVQARMGSSRYWGKVLRGLPTGRIVLREVLYRVSQIKGINEVVLAIPDTPENEVLAHVAGDECRAGRAVWISQGPEHDVLARYHRAADEVGAEIVVRVTADCPLLDPAVCSLVLARHLEDNPLGYTSNTIRRSWPQGFDCEVFSRHWLNTANEQATEPHDREHVTPIMHRFSPGPAQVSTSPDRSHLRWTLDTAEDYEVIKAVFEQQMREAA